MVLEHFFKKRDISQEVFRGGFQVEEKGFECRIGGSKDGNGASFKERVDKASSGEGRDEDGEVFVTGGDFNHIDLRVGCRLNKRVKEEVSEDVPVREEGGGDVQVAIS